MLVQTDPSNFRLERGYPYDPENPGAAIFRDARWRSMLNTSMIAMSRVLPLGLFQASFRTMEELLP